MAARIAISTVTLLTNLFSFSRVLVYAGCFLLSYYIITPNIKFNCFQVQLQQELFSCSVVWRQS